MNVLVVAPHFPPDKTVGAVRMASLVRYLVKTEKVSVLTNIKDSDFPIEGIAYTCVELLAKGRSFARFKENQKRYCNAFLELCEKEKFDVVIVSGGPFFTFEIAVKAKKCGVPCILDYRDPWSFDYRDFKSFFAPKILIERLWELPMERRAVKAAKKVVTVTPGWVKTFWRMYPLQKNKFMLIENGYDDELLKGIDLVASRDGTEKFTIGVFGKAFYYTEKYSKIFLSGLREYQNDIELVQIGNKENNADALLLESGLSPEVLVTTGFMNYEEGIRSLNRADAFVIIDVRKSAIGTKIYDYIYLNKPIIYVGPPNTSFAEMVSSFTNGFVCSNSKEVNSAIKTLKLQSISTLEVGDRSTAYARSEQNKKWVKLLKETVNQTKEKKSDGKG